MEPEKTEDIAVDSPEDIEKATAQGWKSEEDWKGDPPKRGFQTAKEFLEIDGKVNAILKERNGKLIEDVSGLRETMALLVKDSAENKRKALEKERLAHEKEKAQIIDKLTQKRREAITDGDVEQADVLDSQIDKVKAATPPVGPSQEYLGWHSDNEWYASPEEVPSNPKHAEMSAEADIIAARLWDTGRYNTEKEHLEAVTQHIKRMFPEQFENPNRGEPSATETTRATKTSEKKSYTNLPAEAKAACDSFVKDIPGYTREDYMKAYEWDDES